MTNPNLGELAPTQKSHGEGMNQEDIAQLAYEQAFSALEEILAALESDQQSLENAMQLFERGQLLARHCMKLLEGAELKIRRLAGEEQADYHPET